jgi:hypothetical protein
MISTESMSLYEDWELLWYTSLSIKVRICIANKITVAAGVFTTGI